MNNSENKENKIPFESYEICNYKGKIIASGKMLVRLMKAASNAGGTLKADMLEALDEANNEKDFEVKWNNKLNGLL